MLEEGWRGGGKEGEWVGERGRERGRMDRREGRGRMGRGKEGGKEVEREYG